MPDIGFMGVCEKILTSIKESLTKPTLADIITYNGVTSAAFTDAYVRLRHKRLTDKTQNEAFKRDLVSRDEMLADKDYQLGLKTALRNEAEGRAEVFKSRLAETALNGQKGTG